MSARDELMDAVVGYLHAGDFAYRGDAAADAKEYLDAFAHELAEEIRDWDNTYGPFTAQFAADHIDPNTNKEK